MFEDDKKKMIAKFSENLVKARKRRGLSQTQLASEIAVAASTISSYENIHKLPEPDTKDNDDKIARKFPTIYTAWKIAKVLGISLDELCGIKIDQPQTDADVVEKVAEETIEETIKKEVLYLVDAFDNEMTLFQPAESAPHLVPQEWIAPDMNDFFTSYKKRCAAIDNLQEDSQMDIHLIDMLKNDIIDRFMKAAIEKFTARNEVDYES